MVRAKLRIPNILGGKLRSGLLQGTVVALLLLLMWIGNFFTTTRLGMSDLYFLNSEISGKVIIVGIDNPTLQAYGRSPVEWDRTLYADLVRTLNEGGARVVTFDLLFAEPAPGDAALAEAIREARFSDTQRTRVIMPVVGAQSRAITQGDRQAVSFQNTLRPTPVLRDAVESLGYVNVFPDVDGKVRRQLSLVQSGEETELSLSLATFLIYLGIPPAANSQLLVSEGTKLSITPALTPDRKLYVGEGGLWLQNFFGAAGRFPVISMKDVLEGEVEPATFQGKIVLVGLINASGSADRYPVPIGIGNRVMSGVEIQANAIETLLWGMALREQSRFSQALMIIVLAPLATLLYVSLRWYWMLSAALVLLVAWGLVAFIVFDTQHIMINLFHSALAITLPVLVTLGVNTTTEINRR